MIQKNKVTRIELKHGEGMLSSIPSQKRMFKTYAQALKYSVKLRDYYQAPVVEC
jgi:hypothetical protein